MKKEFKPNLDLTKAFKSKIQLINDIPNSENGIVLLQAGADGPPIHIHPEQDELFTIISGRLDVYKTDKWVTLNEGESIFIPKKTPHSYRSRHTKDCVFEYQLTPIRHFSEMMQSFQKLQSEGKLNGKDLKSIVYLSMNFKKYKNEVVSVSPPPFVISAMAGLGKMVGYKL